MLLTVGVVLGGYVFAGSQGMLPYPHFRQDSTYAPVAQDCSGGHVALTFDDGPSILSDTLVQKLGENGLRATFFVNGNHVEEFPNAAKRMIREGHSVQNHGWDHTSMSGAATDTPPLSKPDMLKQIQSTADAISEVGGKSVMFRPPYGDANGALTEVEKEVSHFDVGWDLDTFDYEQPSPQAVLKKFRPVKSGEIVLLHEKEATVGSIDLLAQEMRSRKLCSGQIVSSAEERETWPGYTFHASVASWGAP